MVTRQDVVDIVKSMLVYDQNPEEETGIRVEYDPVRERVVFHTVYLAEFGDLSAAIAAHLEGQPPGQYWLVFNKET